MGTYPIEASGLTAANYAISFTNGALTVLPYALVVAAQDKAKNYGQPDPAFTASYSGFVNGESAGVLGGALTFSRAPGQTVELCNYSVGADLNELCDYVCQWDADRGAGGVDDHSEQPEQGVWGGGAGADGELQRICQWGRGGQSDDGADSDDERDGQQCGGQLRDYGRRGRWTPTTPSATWGGR